MKGIFVNCPLKQCKKPLFKNAYFRPGTIFTTRCYWCGSIISVKSELTVLELRIDKKTEEFDEDDSSIVSLSL